MQNTGINKNEGTNIKAEDKQTSKKSKSQKRNSKEEKLQKLKDASVKDREISTTIGRYKRPKNTDEVLELSKSQQITISKPLSKSQPRIWPGSLDNLPSPEGSKPFPLEKSKSKSGSSLFDRNRIIIPNDDKGEKSRKKKGRWKSLLSVTWFGGKQDKNKNEKTKASNTQTTEDSESFIFKSNEVIESKPTTPTSPTSNIPENINTEDKSDIAHSVSQEISENLKGNDLDKIHSENQESKQKSKMIHDKVKQKGVYNVKTPTEIYNDSRKEEKHGANEITTACSTEDHLDNKPYNVITPTELSAKKMSITSTSSVLDDDVFRFDSPAIHRKDQERRKARLFPNMNPMEQSQNYIYIQNGGENMQPIYQSNHTNRPVDSDKQQQNYTSVQNNVYSSTGPLHQGHFEHGNLPQKQNIYGVPIDAIPLNIQGRPLPPRPLIINQYNKAPYNKDDIYGINSYYPKHHMNEGIYSTGPCNSKNPQAIPIRSRDQLNLPLQNHTVGSQNELYFQRSNSLNYGKQVYAQPSTLLNNNQMQVYRNNVLPTHHPVSHTSSDSNFHQQQIGQYRQRASDLHAAAIHNSRYNRDNQQNVPRQRSVTVGNGIREPIYANDSQKGKLMMSNEKNDSLYVQKNNETHVRPFVNNDPKTGLSQQTVNQMKNNPNIPQNQQLQYQLMPIVPRDNHVKRSHSSLAYSGISDSEYIQLLRNQDHQNMSINNQPIYGYSGAQYKSNMMQPGGYGVRQRINVYKEQPTYDIYNNPYNPKSYPHHTVRSGMPVRRSNSSAFPSKNVYQVQPNSRADLAGHQSQTIHRLLGLNKSDLHIRRSKTMAHQKVRNLHQEANRLHTSQSMHNPNMYMQNYAVNHIQGNPYQNAVNLEGFDEVDRFRSLSLHNSAVNTPLSRSRTSLSLKEDNDHLHSVQNYERNESYQQYPSFNKNSVINAATNVQSNPKYNTKQTSSLKEAYDNQNLHIQMTQKLEEVETDGNKLGPNKTINNVSNINNEHKTLLLQNSTSSNQNTIGNRHNTLSAQNSTSSIQSESSQPMIDNHLEKHKVMLFKEFGVDMDGLIDNLESEDNNISNANGTRDVSKPVISSKTVEIKTSTEINTESENKTEPITDITQKNKRLALNDKKNIPTSPTVTNNCIRLMEPPSSL
ncbi:unnamed protein product [Meganyctiphanes norvegica]|uniref:Uncharacterized protein n=1 Tax=Meganyctiphanes norvegica TaxID=48144 RepID=A0AAV2RJ85_MEGNR